MKKLFLMCLLLVSLVLLIGCVKEATVNEDGSVEVSDDGALAGQAVGRTLTCTDSDGGKNLLLKGTAIGKGARVGSTGYPDRCINEQTVKEFFCASSTATTPSSIQRNCASTATT